VLLRASGAGRPKPFEEAVVPLRPHRDAREAGRAWRCARGGPERGARVAADEHPGLVVVGGEHRVHAAAGRGAVEGEDEHAPGARAAHGGDDGLGVATVTRTTRAPAAIMFSIAVTWPALSPSCGRHR
jgi:hypothetical protein